MAAAHEELVQGVTWLFTRSIASNIPEDLSWKGKSVLERDCLTFVMENHPDPTVRARLHNDGVKHFVDLIPKPRIWNNEFTPPTWATSLQGRVDEFFANSEIQKKIQSWRDPNRPAVKYGKSKRTTHAGEPPKTKSELLLCALEEMFGFTKEQINKLRDTDTVAAMGQALNSLLLISDEHLKNPDLMKIFGDLWILDISYAEAEIEEQELRRQQDELRAAEETLKAKLQETKKQKEARIKDLGDKVRFKR